MASSTLSISIKYLDNINQVSWCGITVDDEDEFNIFMSTDVASRVHDEEATAELTAQLRGLATTGFDHSNIDLILAAEVPETRDWAIGESLAETYLAQKHDIIWPWNMERDKRNPNASLPGTDLIGFKVVGEEVRLAFGEVKSSTDTKSPPGVTIGRKGLIGQLENLLNELSLITVLLKWLWPRCKKTQYQEYFQKACVQLIRSGNRNIALFGILIRDTAPNELDLKNRAESLADSVLNPATCELIAIHIPCKISDLPVRISGDKA